MTSSDFLPLAFGAIAAGFVSYAALLVRKVRRLEREAVRTEFTPGE